MVAKRRVCRVSSTSKLVPRYHALDKGGTERLVYVFVFGDSLYQNRGRFKVNNSTSGLQLTFCFDRGAK